MDNSKTYRQNSTQRIDSKQDNLFQKLKTIFQEYLSDDLSKLKSLYSRCFSPLDYHFTYYSLVDAEVSFFFDSYIEFSFSELEPAAECAGARHVSVADVGCGPVPVYCAAALAALSGHSCSLIMADYLPQNREALLNWKTDNLKEMNWTPCFQYIVTKSNEFHLCSKDGINSAAELERKVRESITAIVSCDVTESNPLGVDVSQRFDVVLSSLCLEFASTSVETYKKSVANVASLLTPAGYLMMAGALDNSWYTLGGVKYPSVRLTEELIKSALQDAGLKIKQFRKMGRTTDRHNKPADHSGVFFVAAQACYSGKCD